tara:strand:- start:18 stop:179 length:162 start_codon:yes stop_codon:yes gene_type:complete
MIDGEENLRSRKATEKLGAVLYKKNIDGKLIYLLLNQYYILKDEKISKYFHNL